MLDHEVESVLEAAASTFGSDGYFPDIVTYVTPQGSIISPIEDVYEIVKKVDLPLEVIASSIRKRANASHVITTFKIGNSNGYSNVLYFQSPIEDRLFLCCFGDSSMDVLEIPVTTLSIPDMYGRRVLEN